VARRGRTAGAAGDWSIVSLSLLADHLASLREDGVRFDVTARNREPGRDGVDPVGASLCTLGGVGDAHHFHSRNREPEPARQVADDVGTPSISWPNYHAGRNGDFQRIVAVPPVHELLRGDGGEPIAFLPAHPHEGAVGVPPGDGSARVVAQGTSLTTGRRFNLAVAFERSRDAEGRLLGRGVAESSFHHLADYNWDPRRGAPSFVSEPVGDGMEREPRALADVRRWVRNLAVWLAPPA
jgi:hypothetical protein